MKLCVSASILFSAFGFENCQCNLNMKIVKNSSIPFQQISACQTFVLKYIILSLNVPLTSNAFT